MTLNTVEKSKMYTYFIVFFIIALKWNTWNYVNHYTIVGKKFTEQIA